VHWQDLQYFKVRPTPQRTRPLPAHVDRSARLDGQSLDCDDGEEHFLHPGGHLLQLTPCQSDSGRVGWTCKGCSFRDAYTTQEPSYRCDRCDFDLCRDCWNRNPDPCSDGDGQGTSANCNQRASKPSLRHVACLLIYGTTRGGKIYPKKNVSQFPTARTVNQSKPNNSTSDETFLDLNSSWHCGYCLSRNPLIEVFCGPCRGFEHPRPTAEVSARKVTAMPALKSTGPKGKSGGTGGSKRGQGKTPSSSGHALALSDRHSAVSASSWVLQLKSGLRGPHEPVYFSCRVDGEEVGKIAVPPASNHNHGSGSAVPGYFVVQRTFRHPRGVSQKCVDAQDVTLELQRLTDDNACRNSGTLHSCTVSLFSFGDDPNSASFSDSASSSSSSSLSLSSSSSSSLSSSSSSSSSNAMDLVVDPSEASSQKSIEAFEQLLDDGAATRVAQATRLLSDDPLGSMLNDAGAGLVHLEVIAWCTAL